MVLNIWLFIFLRLLFSFKFFEIHDFDGDFRVFFKFSLHLTFFELHFSNIFSVLFLFGLKLFGRHIFPIFEETKIGLSFGFKQIVMVSNRIVISGIQKIWAEREITFIHIVLDLLFFKFKFFNEISLLFDLLIDLFEFIWLFIVLLMFRFMNLQLNRILVERCD